MHYNSDWCHVLTDAWGNCLSGWMQILWLIFTHTLLPNPCQCLPLSISISFQQPICKVLHFFHQYMMSCNYFWMLCEGVYLHTLIVVSVFAEGQRLWWYHVLGWGRYFPQLSFEPSLPLSVYLQSSSSLGLREESGPRSFEERGARLLTGV